MDFGYFRETSKWGNPSRDIRSLGVMGEGPGNPRFVATPSHRRRQAQNGSKFPKNGIVRFLTHSRVHGLILLPNWSHGRPASFLIFQNNMTLGHLDKKWSTMTYTFTFSEVPCFPKCLVFQKLSGKKKNTLHGRSNTTLSEKKWTFLKSFGTCLEACRTSV